MLRWIPATMFFMCLALQMDAQLTPQQLEQRKIEKLLGSNVSAGSARGGAPEQDCNNAIAVCQSTFIQPSAYSGFGNIQEVPTSSCLGSQEKNSVWYIFTVQNSGTLTFTISPNDMNDDYDFALYNITGLNCSDIITGAAPEVRCNYCVDPGNTGISAAGVNASEDCCTNSPGCQFSSILNVTTGQTYTLVVSNYSSSQSGYTLTFGGTASIFDNQPPVPSSVTTPCNTNFMTLQMSEAVLCSSIAADGSDFSLSGPGGPFTITGASGVNCGNATSQITINFSPPVTIGSTYTLTINRGTDNNTLIDNCGNAAQAGTSLTFTATPPPASILGPADVCKGNPITLTASQGTSYNWNTGATTQSIQVSPVSNTTFSVTVTNGTCVQTASKTITVKDAPTAAFTVSPNPVCAGQPVTFTNTSTYLQTCILPPIICIPNPTFLIWNFDDGTVTTQLSLAATNPTHTFTSPGVYDVTLTAQDTLVGGCSHSATVSVTVLSTGNSLVASADTSICSGASVTLTASGGASYTWSSDPPGFSANTASVTVSPTVTTTYIVSSPGCSGTQRDSVVVTVTNISVSVNPSVATLCPGDSVLLTASGASTYNWTPVAGLNTSTGAVVRAAPQTTTTYRVTGTTGGCSATDSVVVQVQPAPAPVISADGPVSFCLGDSVTLDAGSYASYQWSTGDTLQTLTVSQTGSYSVTVMDASGCTGTASLSITASNTLSPIITASGPLTFCAGDSVVLHAGGGYDSYSWSTGETTASITVKAPGNFAVTVTSSSCSGVSQPVTVTVDPAPSPLITANGPLSFCIGGSVVLDAGSGYTSYLWNTGDTSRTITVTQSGNYAVTVSNGTCSGVAPQVTVTSAADLKPVITASGPLDFCAGHSVTLDAGMGYDYYIWSTAETTQTVVVSSGGLYAVTVSSGTGCSGSDTVQVTVNPNPVVSYYDTCILGKAAIELIAQGGNPPYTYFWSNAENSSSLVGLENGSYRVTVLDSRLCGDSLVIVTECREDVPLYLIPSAFSPNGDGVNDFIYVMGDRAQVSRYVLRIYNRWGQLVYATDDLSLISSNPAAPGGWDGSFKGENQEAGVYAYVAELYLQSGRKLLLKGNVTLIK
ncbi:MAG: hypothetical protein KatS3mg031_0438 [Chitinophagales bacterium]|nr:MAG: hypothetical protein KatS3mg031_0438 [Chitinophagales bacterium]